MSLTPCAFRQRATISLPVNSAISFLLSRVVSSFPRKREPRATCSIRGPWAPAFARATGYSNHPFVLQGVDIGGAHAEPVAENLRRVLSEQRRGFELWRLAVKAHRPGRHLERSGRVLCRLQNAALGKARLVHQLH